MDPALRRTALWATAIQGLFALTWALYVAFLPALLTRAGFDARLAIVFVLLDQAVFAVADWAAGVYADRLARLLGRIGPALTACAVFSSCALAALPWIAQLGSPALLVGITVLWTASSSALRAPVFTLLGRVGGSIRPAGTVSVALLGVGVANAVAPLFTKSLAQVDAVFALTVCAVALAFAALFASRLEQASPAAASKDEPPVSRSPVYFITALVLLGAFGVQVQTVVLGGRAAKAGFEWATFWSPVFWVGFALGLAIATLIGRARPQETAAPLRAGGAGLALGAAAAVVAQMASNTAMFTVAQGFAGAAWAVFASVAVRAAMTHGGGRGIGAPLGLIFSALAVAALARVGLTIAGWQGEAWLAWVPAVVFATSGVVLVLFASAKGAPAAAPATR